MNNKSKTAVSNSDVCVCPDVSGIVAGNEVRLQSAEVNEELEGVACSVVSIVKHKIHNVCTWHKSDLQEIHSEGSKLVKDMKAKGKGEDCLFHHRFGGQYSVFNKTCKVTTGKALCGTKIELYEKLQEMLFSHEYCLMNINGDMCTIVRHNDFYVIVDCNVRNACGLGSDIGTSVVIFNTNWQDLVFHRDETVLKFHITIIVTQIITVIGIITVLRWKCSKRTNAHT
ncbi:MAG: hypothetical protein ACRCW3_00885 [Metamycoplasmataceae bacterium]